MLLRGHLYFRAARSFAPRENLALLLAALRERSSLAEALDGVAGGMFGLVAIDRARQTISAAVDRLGCMPLYYREAKDGLFFSPNSSAFFEQGALLSEAAVVEYLKYGYLPFADSMFESVHRVRPGETLTAALGPRPSLTSMRRPPRPYLPPAERVQSPDEGAARLIVALDGYFARLGAGRGVSGLSGGYDSRLIAAYAAPGGFSFVNFGNPRSREVRYAREVARRLGRPLESFRIPEDAPARHGDRFREVMVGLDSFEDAHVLELAARVEGMGADCYVDGFLGDTIIGGGYYYQLGRGVREVLASLTLRRRFESPLRNAEDYVALVCANKRAVPDDALRGLVAGEAGEAMRERARHLVEEHLPRCPTHEDVVESLTHAARGSRLIAGGPVALSRFTLCLCPFIDHDVFDTALACAKHVRAGDRLYNAVWRQRFPALADVPKANTGGRPRDGDRTYRLKHLLSALARRHVYPRLKRLTGGRWDRTEAYSTAEGYLADPTTRDYLRGLARHAGERLPPRVRAALLDDYLALRLSPAVLLRLGALLAYLS